MEITESTESPSRVPGIPGKPLDNPWRTKPRPASDAEIALLLESVLREVPTQLGGEHHSSVPRLSTLLDVDARRGTECARQLMIIAALCHRAADERRTAEYFLRNRHAVAGGQRSGLSLLRAARLAAQMDLQNGAEQEISVPHETLALWPLDAPASRVGDPSVGEMVLEKLRAVTGIDPSSRCEEWVRDAVVIAFELAQRHARRRGNGPSLLAMRADARKEARLVTRLRAESIPGAAAGRIARLLVGAESSPIESALLLWCAQHDFVPDGVPASIRDRWRRDIRGADACAASGPEPRPAIRPCRMTARTSKSPTCSPSFWMAVSRGR